MKLIDYIVILYIIIFIPLASYKSYCMYLDNLPTKSSVEYSYTEQAKVYIGEDKLELEVTYCNDNTEINSMKSEIIGDYVFVGSYEDMESIINLCLENQPIDNTVTYLRDYYKNIVITSLNNIKI